MIRRLAFIGVAAVTVLGIAAVSYENTAARLGDAAWGEHLAEGRRVIDDLVRGRDPTIVPQVVLLDLELPRIDGLEVLRRNRADERTRRLPVVVLASSKEDQDLAESHDIGANSYVRKSVDFNQFLEAVGRLGLYWLVVNEPPPR